MGGLEKDRLSDVWQLKSGTQFIHLLLIVAW